MRVVLRRPAVKALRDMDDRMQERVKAALFALADDPRQGDVKKLKGTQGREDLYRLRIGPLRAFFALSHDEVIVIDIRKRGSAY